jgi:hypothetical protein
MPFKTMQSMMLRQIDVAMCDKLSFSQCYPLGTPGIKASVLHCNISKHLWNDYCLSLLLFFMPENCSFLRVYL